MQPLKPEELEKIKKDYPQAAPEDVERYQELLSKRFTVDPDRPSPQAAPLRDLAKLGKPGAPEDIETELQELHQRIFRKTAKPR